MQNINLDFNQFIRSVEISKAEGFTVLLGAGASVNSGIKSAMDCIWEWKRDIYLTEFSHNVNLKLDERSDQVRHTIQKWLDNEGVYPALNHHEEYAFYIEKCYPIEEDRRKYFQRLSDKKEPSIGYKLLSLLYQSGMIKSIWTTNFDDLSRNAAIKTGTTVIDISLDSVERIIRPMNNSELIIVKLHGDYKYGPLKNTNTELKNQDDILRERLKSYLDDKHLMVFGYSGRDESVMTALTESYSKPGAGRLYWCGYGEEIPEEIRKLIEIARSYGRDAYYIPTDGFDKSMISLAKNCCRDNPELNNLFIEYLKTTTQLPENKAFSISQTNTSSIIKSNLFPVKLPHEAFQFQSNITTEPSPWKAIRELIKEYPIVAVPFKGYVWALGTLGDLNKCFDGKINGSITRVPLGELNLYRDSAIYNLMLSALTKSLAQANGLKCNYKDRIWKIQHTSQRILNDVYYSTHESVKLTLNTDGERYYLSLIPDFQISSEVPHIQITKEIKQEIGRSYFDKLRNKQFDDYILSWRKFFFISNSDKVLLEYPNKSGSGFNFEIYKFPLFSSIAKHQTTSGIELDKKFPKHILHFKGIQYREPELIFSERHPGMNTIAKDFHPMRGLTKNKPYDNDLTGVLFENTIRLGIICPTRNASSFYVFLQKHLNKVSSLNVNADYLIDYPGFHEIYGVSLNIPDPNSPNWRDCPEPFDKPTLKETAFQLRNSIITQIEHLIKDDIKKVIIIFIPTRWLDYTSFDLENEDFDLHDYIKAYCAEKSIATQFIQENTISSQLGCQINWWLSLSYYVKSLRTPWILEDLDKDTAFAGIGYSIKSRKESHNDIVLGCSHIYNSQGQGLKYKLAKVEDQLYWDNQDRPHLSYNDAFRFGVSIRELFYNAMNDLPKRVVIHKRTYFTKDEINGLRDSLLNSGIQDLDLIEINFTDDIRFLATKIQNGMPETDNFAVPRGTCIKFNDNTLLLWTHGIVPSVRNPNYKYYLGGKYIPGPLKIIKHLGNSNIGTIVNEILGLTKMNWNSLDLYSQLPATVNSSNEIARIGRLLLKREGVTYDYRYFI